MMNPRLTAALELAARGLAVLPVNPATKLPNWRLVPRNKDKDGKPIPATGGVKNATKDPEIIRSWWTRFPDSNVGIALGEPSGGVVAFDVDGPEDEQILNDCGLAVLSSTLETKSGRADGSGRHIFFKASGDGLRNRTVKGGGIRATGYYVVAPPSVHKDKVVHRLAFVLTKVCHSDWLVAASAQRTKQMPEARRIRKHENGRNLRESARGTY